MGGAAYAAGRAGARRAANEQGQDEAIAELQAEQQQQAVQQQQQAYAPPPQPVAPQPVAPVASGGGGEDVASKLNQLAQLVQQGLLTPEEFAAAKARLLS
ncbi:MULTISPECIES: SHOCT domain-containing protein [Kitasatospora]|uniref:SHOCT domain-containing protein n=1 Tax=Kitasatospora TaxID=2063 RepID=UPI0002F277F4|nr:SHOCT domain-containing protein [Kitasatospora setae]